MGGGRGAAVFGLVEVWPCMLKPPSLSPPLPPPPLALLFPSHGPLLLNPRVMELRERVDARQWRSSSETFTSGPTSFNLPSLSSEERVELLSVPRMSMTEPLRVTLKYPQVMNARCVNSGEGERRLMVLNIPSSRVKDLAGAPEWIEGFPGHALTDRRFGYTFSLSSPGPYINALSF